MHNISIFIYAMVNYALRLLWLTMRAILSLWYFVLDIKNEIDSFLISSILSIDNFLKSNGLSKRNLNLWGEMQISMLIHAIVNYCLRLLWLTMHVTLSLWYFVLDLKNEVDSFLVSRGLSKRYTDVDISKVQCLAVVVDSEEARQTWKVLQLLQWLANIGLTNVCLYDKEGVLKRSEEALLLLLKVEKLNEETTSGQPLGDQTNMNLELISFSDGKHAVARAANFLFKCHYLSAKSEDLNLTESDMSDALGAIGCGGLEPDLMLIYGPARCHLGFPAWRIRYTEIVHMGPLLSMKFGALVKAMHKFTKVHQNHGA